MLSAVPSFLGAALLLSCTLSPPTSSFPSSSTPTQQPEVVYAPLPETIGDRVKADLANELGIPTEQLVLGYHSRETWTDGCLGLGGPTEACLAALTEGWQVEVIDVQSDQRYVYRTNLSGEHIRRSTLSQNLPPSIRDRIFQSAEANNLGLAENFEIIDAQPQTWDGCYGLPVPDEGCTEIAVWGWRTLISDGTQHLIYHTDNLGNDIHLNETASLTNASIALISRFSPEDLGDETVFQSIISHGSGKREVFMLESDGQLFYSQQQDGELVQQDIISVSQGRVDTLLNQLEQSNYAHLDGTRYESSSDAANEPIVQLITRTGTVEYDASSVTDLPPELQQVVQQWANLTDSIDTAADV